MTDAFQRKKVLLDTDIGSDIDDAVCLAYLLREPRCELMGITTVSGDPVTRARLASVLCWAAGQPDIPIYPGSELPLLGPQQQPAVPQAAVLNRYAHAESFARHRHISFMIETIRRHPGEISLLSVGQMTNVALLFRTDPQIPSLLKELVVMGGVFQYRLPRLPRVEANARMDPTAAAIVYNTPAPIHRTIGLDVTCQVRMEREEVRARFQTGLLHVVLDMAGPWFDRHSHITFHDPLAAVALFDESVCSFERGTVSVDLHSERLKGVTYWDPAEVGPHEIALQVDPEAFYRTYFDVLEA